MRKKIVLFLLATALLMFASDLDYDITRVKTVSDDAYIPSLIAHLDDAFHFFSHTGQGCLPTMEQREELMYGKVAKWLETLESLEEYPLVRMIPRGGVVIGRAWNSEYVPIIIGHLEEALVVFDGLKDNIPEDKIQEAQELASAWAEAVNTLEEYEYAVSLDKDVYLRRKYAADYEREKLPRVSSLDSLVAYRAGLVPPQVGIIGAATTSGPDDTTLKLEIPGITKDEVNLLIGVMVAGTRIPKELPSERPSELIEDLRWLHFKKFIVTDGEQTWSWDL